MSATEEETAIWESIQQDTPLYKDDVVRLYFQLSGIMWLELYQLDQIDKKLEGNPDFEVLNHSIPDEKNLMFWTVRVRHNSPVVVALVVAAILGVCITCLWGPQLYFKGATRYLQAKVEAKEKGVEDKDWSIFRDLFGDLNIGEESLQVALAVIAVIVAWSWLKGK